MALSLSVSAFAVEYDTHIDPNCPVCNYAKSKNAVDDILAAALSFADVSSAHTFHDAIIWCAGEEKPETPIQPDQTGKTLTNGKPVTEANILELLSELQAKYPEHTSFVNGYRDGIKSYDVLKVTNTYDRAKGGKTSTSAGCGGWAALVSDYIFGQTGFPARKIATADARPGDIGISVDGNGKLTHVFIVTSRAQHNDECQWTEFDTTDSSTTGPNNTYEIIWDMGGCEWDNPQPGDWTVDIWTRYPN